MYSVSLILAIAGAFFAGRFSVSIAARIERRWLRRLVIWLVVFPSVSAVCLYATATFGDDMILLRLPRLFIGVFLPTTVFAVSFMISAFRGFKMNPEAQARRACQWRDGRRLVALTAALGASLIAYDWQLKNDLIQLKETTLAEWQQTQQEVIPDDQNAASEFLSFGEFHEDLDAWQTKAQTRFGTGLSGENINAELFFSTIPNSANVEDEDSFTPETLYVETNFSDEWFVGLQDCEGAFQQLREGAAKPQLAIVWPLEYPNDEDLKTEFSLLTKTIGLFQINLLAVASRGNLQQAYSDVNILLTIARHFEGDITSRGQRVGSFARGKARAAIEHLLYLEPQPPAELLKPLVQEKHNPRFRLPEAMKWETARFITQKCDAHLGLLKQAERELPGDLRVMDRFPPFLPSRLAMAGDDMALAQARSVIYQKFADRWADPSMTGEKLLEESRNHWPPLTYSGDDHRDVQFFSANARHDSQQSINLMVAATLFHIQTGEFPGKVSDLVPEILSAVPVSMRDGKSFSLHSFNQGLIVCSPFDLDAAVTVVSAHKSVGFAEDFYGSTFLGPAYRLAHIREQTQQEEPTDRP
jgi:hypothetical protein